MPTVPMMQDHPRNSVLESWYVRAMDKLLRSTAESFTVRKVVGSDTTIEVPATADRRDGAPAVISVDGAWRFNDVTVTRAHPGGAGGTFGVFAVAKNNSIASTPLPFTDNTDYTFDLRIVAGTGTPTIVPGTVDRFRKVGELDWDGVRITRLEQYVGDVEAATPRAAGYATTIGNGTSTSFTIAHGMGTPDVDVVVRDVASGEVVGVEWRVLTDSSVQIVTDTPPAAASLRVLVIGATLGQVSPAVGTYPATIGTGVSEGPFVVTHNLGTRDVMVNVWRTIAPFDEPVVEVEHTDGNTVTIRTPGFTPAAGELGVLVMTRSGLQGAAAQHASQHRGGGSDPIFIPGALQSVRTVGEPGQVAAGRTLTVADFTALGLAAPLGLWNLADLTDVSGNGRALTNKGTVPFGPGINGAAGEAAVFAGSTAQALYIADTGAADPFRIKTGSWGCWFRTAKRAAQQGLVSKFGGGGTGAFANKSWALEINGANVASALISFDGVATSIPITGSSDVADDRWHFGVVTFDGTVGRVYLDGALEARANGSGVLFGSPGPLNIGNYGADGATNGVTATMHYGREQVAFVTSDVLTEEQVRALMARSVPHGMPGVPSTAALRVTRRKRGAALVQADFPVPASLVRGHNFDGASLTDFSAAGVPLTPNPGTGAIVAVAAPDGTRDGAWSFSGAHTGLSATDAGLPAALTARSYGLWFKTTNAAANQGLMGWGTITTGDARVQVTTPGGTLNAISAGDGIVSGFVADGLWHLAIVVEDNAAADGVKRKLYVDARLVGGSTILNTLTLAGANRFRVGANPDGTLPFTGQASRAFVFAGALTPEQVRALYAVSSLMVPASPKDAADNIEYMDALNLYVVHSDLEPQDRIEVVAA